MKMNKFLFYLTLPFNGYFLMNNEFNEEWDKKFNQLLNDNEFEIIDYYYARLGNQVIWITNRPYGQFKYDVTLVNNRPSPTLVTVRPSRYSIYLANKKLNQAFEKLRREAFDKIK